MNIEDLARQAGYDRMNTWERSALTELSRLVRNEALEEAAQTVEAQDTYGTSSPAAIRALKE